LRGEIIDAATRLTATTGDASKVTLRAVAREVGVAATSIYLHFDTINALVDEVKRCRFQELGDALNAAADAAGHDPVLRVKARAFAYIRYGQDHPGEYAIMFTANLQTPSGIYPRPPQTVDALTQLAADIGHARPGGQDLDETQAMLFAFHIWTSLHGTVMLRLARPALPWPDVDTQLEDLVDHLLRAAPAEERRHSAGT